MIAICSNTTVYVGVTIFALCGPVGVSVGFEAARFLSATGVGLLIAVASGTFLYSQALRTLLFGNRDRYRGVSRQWRCLRFSFRQCGEHSCLATETGTMAFLASGGASDSVFDSVENTPVWQQRQVPWRFSPVEVPQIQFSTSGWTFLFGNRDRYRGFSRLCVPLANRPSRCRVLSRNR